jgi:hypothetical protein
VAILSAFAVAHKNLAPLEVDILDSQMERLQQPETAAIQQTAHDPIGAGELREKGATTKRWLGRPGDEQDVPSPDRAAR